MEWILGGEHASAAAGLIKEFGTVGAALAGSERRQLRALGGDRRALTALRQFRATMLHVLREEVRFRPVLGNWQAVVDYLQADMAHLTTERVRVLHLNTRNMLIADEVMVEGTIDEAVLHVRELMHRALDLGSAALIIAHNHPSGDPAPSRADVDLSRAIADAGKRLGVRLHDHMIFGIKGHVSLRQRNLI